MNRFWRSLVAGGAAGAAIGAFFYVRSRMRRARMVAAGAAEARSAARSAGAMIKRATGRVMTRVGASIERAGLKTGAPGRRADR